MFDQCVPRDVADAVLALLVDVEPLAAALRRRPCTLAHGDLATVNMAFSGDDLVLLDWSMPTVAPGAVDVARFVAGCSSVVALGREELLAGYRRAAGPAYDDSRDAARPALGARLAGLEQGAGRHGEPRSGHPGQGEGGPRLVGP